MRRSALAVFATAMLSPALVAPGALATPVGPVWTSPVDLGVVGHSARTPQASMGLGGDVTALLLDGNPMSGQLLAQSHPAGGSWSTTTALSDPAKAVGLYSVATSPTDDSAVAIFGQNTPADLPGMPGMRMPGPNQIYVASRMAGGAWGTARALSPDPTVSAASAPSIALGADGRAVALWTEQDFNMYASIRSGDGTWSTPAVVGSGSDSVDTSTIALRPDGSAVAVWQRDGQLESAVLHGSTWSAVTQLGGGYVPQLALDGAGRATIAYQGPAGRSEQVRALALDDTWSAPHQLSVDIGGESYYAPSLAVAADGTAVVSWAQEPGGNPYLAATRDASGTWSAGTQVGTEGWLGGAAAAGDGGFAALAWAGSSSTMQTPLFDGGSWSAPGVEEWGSAPGENPVISGDGHGSEVGVFQDLSGVIHASFLDHSGPDLRALTVPATGNAGAAVHVSVDPRDAVSGLGDTTWDFGDGTAPSTGVSAAHTYANAGTYTVTVTAKDTLNFATRQTRTITVGAALAQGRIPDESHTALDTRTTTSTTTTKTTNNAPAPRPQTPKPTVMLAHTQRLATILGRQAIRTTIVAPAGGSISVTATVARADARKLGLKSTRLATLTTKAKDTKPVPVSLKLSKAIRTRAAKLKSLVVTLTVTYTAADGTRTTAVTKLTTRS